MKSNKQKTEDKALQAAVLKQKADAYIAGMEAPGKGINFDHIPTDRLLIIEAFNDWSAGALGEGGSVHFTYSGADPTCATADELQELINRVHQGTALIYPVSGFLLSDNEENLRFRPLDASYRLTAHSDESRASAVNVAAAKHVSNVEACHQLWIFCATEDCMAYLEHQMAPYELWLEDEENIATRRLISSYLQDQFSPGQIWNAIWRSVKHAAALSQRQYFNSAKAAKTIPKQIDKVLTEASGNIAFQAYDRPTQTPLSAVLTLFHQRFGLDDSTPGIHVREALISDSALTLEKEKANEDNESNEPERALLRGTMYFSKNYTKLDQFAIACIEGACLDSETPNWDDSQNIGYLNFTAPDLYSFDGSNFYSTIAELLGVDVPSGDEVAKRVLSMRNDEWAEERAYGMLMTESLIAAGVSPTAARKISLANRFPLEPEELVSILQGLPIPSGLVAMRITYACIDGDYITSKDSIAVGEYTIDFPEPWFEPRGSDRELAIGSSTGDTESIAALLARAIAGSIRCEDQENRDLLLKKVANNLLEITYKKITA